jgi:hypothetical protein
VECLLRARAYDSRPGWIGPARGGWFALVSGEQSADLNLCALTPEARVEAADELVGVLGPDLPAVIFRSQLADPGTTTRLEQLGFSTAQDPEPLMVCLRPPAPADAPFRIRRASEHEIDHGIAISSEAHEVGRAMLKRTLARTPRDVMQLWLAWTARSRSARSGCSGATAPSGSGR